MNRRVTAAVSYLATAQMIERTHFDLARIERNDHVVDSDR